jgi:hypothetical protein
MTIPVRIGLSGSLVPLLSESGATDLGREVETHASQLASSLGLEGAVSVEVTATDTRRPLRVEVNGKSVPYPPDLISRLSMRRLSDGGFAENGFGPTIAGDCLAARAGDGECSIPEVGELVADMIRDRPSMLVDREEAVGYAADAGCDEEDCAALERVLMGLLDLGVAPLPKETVLAAVVQNRGRVGDAIEAAFAALQLGPVEILVAPRYRAALTGRDDDASQLVAQTGMEDTAEEMFELLEQRLLVEWGIVPPDLVWTTDPAIPEGSIAVKINDRRSPPFPGLPADERVVLSGAWDASTELDFQAQREIPNPANAWLKLAIVDVAAAERLNDSVPTAPPAGFVALVVYGELIANAHRLIGTEHTLYLLQDLESRSPELVHLVLRHFSIPEITELLRALARERIPPRVLPVVLEQLARLVLRPIPEGERAEFVRRGLSDYIEHRFGRGDQARTFFELAPELERLIGDVPPDDLLAEGFRDEVWRKLAEHRVPPVRAAVLAPEAVRQRVYRLLEPELPEIAVVLRSDFGGRAPDTVAAFELPAVTAR